MNYRIHPGTSDLPPRIPLVLGVVGHRVLRKEDEPVLREALKKTFREFQEAFPYTPLVLLSALAEGADQLAAEVAMACGVAVRAPLPFPVEVYRESSTFSRNEKGKLTETGRIAVERLERWTQEGAVDCFVVPLPRFGDPARLDRWREKCEDREDCLACYANAGGYIARHCHVLIALWDGETDPLDALGRRKSAGTADYVVFKLTGAPPEAYPRSEPLGYRGDCGPVLVIQTPRENAPSTNPPGMRIARLPGEREPQPGEVLAKRAGNLQHFLGRLASSFGLTDVGEEQPLGRLVRSFETMLLGTDGGGPAVAEIRRFHAQCAALDDFNADAALHEAEIRPRLQETLNTLAEDEHGNATLSALLMQVARAHDAADILSKIVSRQTKGKEWTARATAFAGLLCLVFYLVIQWDYWLAGFGTAILAWLFMTIGSLWHRQDQRSQDYSALAEILRVRCFWALAGLKDSVAESYLNEGQNEIAWTRQALRSICPPPRSWRTEFDALSEEESWRRMKIASQRWVSERKETHGRRAAEHQLWGAGLLFGGMALAGAGAVLLVIAQLLDIEAKDFTPGGGARNWAIAFSALCIGAGGLLSMIAKCKQHRPLAARYRRLAQIFADGESELERRINASEISQVREILRTLGRAALEDQAVWLNSQRAR